MPQNNSPEVSGGSFDLPETASDDNIPVGLEALVKEPDSAPSVPRKLIEEVEKLLQTLTQEQILLLVELSKKALKYAKCKSKTQ